MIEVADGNAVYYYHFDALGSVVALSDSAGDTVQTYEYSIYGQVAVEDTNHPNPYMFAGRRYDIEIGLYYNRARYYNPYTGRFLQIDPNGYEDGMNLYRYCKNNPSVFVDPSGNAPVYIHYLAVYGGYWANRLPKPSYPGNWTSWVDFFAWYAHGEGETVSLSKLGLLDDFRHSEQIQTWTEALRLEMNEMAKNLAKQILSMGRSEASITFTRKHPYNFGGGLEQILLKVAMGLIAPPLADPLVVLGKGYLVAEIEIKVERLRDSKGKFTFRVFWSSTINYSVKDAFSDPGDLSNKYPGEVEWLDCIPYEIHASFSSINTGYYPY